MDKPVIGAIGWIDLTVPNATEVKDFYAAVTGWEVAPVSMGDYDDYTMSSDGEARAGVCHKRGQNENIPSNWMIYINVADIEKSREECTGRGGELLSDIIGMGAMGRYCFIKDPAGAVCALFEHNQ